MAELQKSQPVFDQTNTALVALSVDDPKQSAAIKQEMGLGFELLCDPTRKVVKDWGLFNPYEAGGIAVPAVFVITTDRVVHFRAIEKTNKRVSMDLLTQFLQKLAQDPKHAVEKADIERIMPNGTAWKQMAINVFKRGDADDWKHMFLFPFENLNMVLARFRKKKKP